MNVLRHESNHGSHIASEDTVANIEARHADKTIEELREYVTEYHGMPYGSYDDVASRTGLYIILGDGSAGV